MRRTSLPALLALTAIWVRSTQSRRAALILTAVFTVVTAVTLSVSALTLSTAQQQAKQFGRYQQASYLSLHVGDLTPGSTAIAGPLIGRARDSACGAGNHQSTCANALSAEKR